MGLSLYEMNSAMNDATGRARDNAKSGTGMFLERASRFNAGDAIKTAAGGLFDMFQKRLGQGTQDLRGSQVGAGRLTGGYGAEDENALRFNAQSDFNDKIAGLAVTGTQMDQANTRDLGQFGQGEEQQYLDLLTGGLDRQQAAQNAKQNRKSSLWGSLAGLAGTVFGGPIGGYIGKKLFS